MKRVVYVGIAALVLLTGASACKKVSSKKVEKNLVDGTWKVTLYSDDNVTETADYTNYQFEFNDDGSLIATANGQTFSGTWSVDSDDSDDDSTSDTDLNISFAVLNNLDEFTDDWDVVSQSNDKIELKDVSGDGSVDLLTFEKL